MGRGAGPFVQSPGGGSTSHINPGLWMLGSFIEPQSKKRRKAGRLEHPLSAVAGRHTPQNVHPPDLLKKERKHTNQGRDGRTARRHHTGILRFPMPVSEGKPCPAPRAPGKAQEWPRASEAYSVNSRSEKKIYGIRRFWESFWNTLEYLRIPPPPPQR